MVKTKVFVKYDRIMTRNKDSEPWEVALYLSRTTDGKGFVTSLGNKSQALPFTEYRYLDGKVEMPADPELLKPGDMIEVMDGDVWHRAIYAGVINNAVCAVTIDQLKYAVTNCNNNISMLRYMYVRPVQKEEFVPICTSKQ
ncbi:MAG: hypothetical protein IKO41_21435 [Lachnospiraceae bacterium]|nr:hypothetical protein [Lachnospiraceae bacterium]